MSETTTQIHLDLHVHILQLLDLCRYAAMALTAVEGALTTARIHPQFQLLLNTSALEINKRSDSGGGTIVACGLYVAMELLRANDSPNVPTRDISANQREGLSHGTKT